jgi:citrate lyase subunit beta/citryl-CoA lyase
VIDPPPLRSLLFVPGHRDQWAPKAVAAGADGILFDLQDSVPEAEKVRARGVVAAMVGRIRRPVLVRVAPLGAPGHDADLEAVVRPGLAGVVVPLVTGPDDVRAVADRLGALERDRGMPEGSTVVVPLVETARAARLAFEVATASDRVAYMGGGTAPDGDIAHDIGFRWTPGGMETLFLRSWVLMNVRAAGVPFPLSGIWPIVDDLDGLRAFAEQARGLGYTGMMAIHPSHVPVINDVFTPTADEIARWRGTIEALEAGPGAARLRGMMVDAAHGRTARDALAAAARLGPGGRT